MSKYDTWVAWGLIILAIGTLLVMFIYEVIRADKELDTKQRVRNALDMIGAMGPPYDDDKRRIDRDFNK